MELFNGTRPYVPIQCTPIRQYRRCATAFRNGQSGAVDDHQRRVVTEMLDKVRLFRSGDLDLGTLVQNLQGLMGAADFKSTRLIDDFWMHEAPIDGEHELRTEPWAPPGSASDESLNAALDAFVGWVHALLSDPSRERA